MKTYEWSLSVGLVGCTQRGTIQLEDDLSEEEIEAIIRDEVFEHVDWSYKEVS